MNAILRRLVGAVVALVVLVLVGATGFCLLGHGRWSFGDCVYMTVITLSTVGFSELDHMREVHGARVLTIFLIISGVGALAYVQGNLTALLVEGVIGQAFRRTRMRKKIAELSGHMIVAGAGATGRHIIAELAATGTPFVVIERDEERAQRVSDQNAGGTMLYVIGDATDDEALLAAGIKSARGVVAALTHDKDNLFVVLSARSLNSEARIVAKAIADESVPKLKTAGADAVVSPTTIGGRAMVNELIRPEVTEFFQELVRDKDKNLRIEEVSVPDGSSFVGQMLKDTPIRRETKLLVVAVRSPDRVFTYNPDPDHRITAGTTLIVLGGAESVQLLRKLVVG